MPNSINDNFEAYTRKKNTGWGFVKIPSLPDIMEIYRWGNEGHETLWLAQSARQGRTQPLGVKERSEAVKILKSHKVDFDRLDWTTRGEGKKDFRGYSIIVRLIPGTYRSGPKTLANPTKRKNSPNDNRIPREHALAAGGLIAQVHAGEREPFPFPIKLYLLAIRARDWDGKEYQIEQDREAAIEARQILIQEVGRLRARGISPYKKSNPRKRKNPPRQNPSSYFTVVWQNVDGAGVFPEQFLDIDEAIANAQGRQLLTDSGGNAWHEFYTVVERWPDVYRHIEVFTTADRRANPKAQKGCRDAAGKFIPTPACRGWGRTRGKGVPKKAKKRSKGRKSTKFFVDF